MGDFNTFLTMMDEYGGFQIGNSHDVAFWEFVQYLEGLDISFKGLLYTCTNKRVRIANIQERLIRLFANLIGESSTLKLVYII